MTAHPEAPVPQEAPRRQVGRTILGVLVGLAVYVALSWLFDTHLDPRPFSLARTLMHAFSTMVLGAIFLVLWRRWNGR